MGGLLGGGAGKAAAAQTDAANQSLALQKQIYDQTRADSMPFYNSGVAANDRLSIMLGLAKPTTTKTYSGHDPASDAAYKQWLTTKDVTAASGRDDSEGNRQMYYGGGNIVSNTTDPMSDPSYGSLAKSFTMADYQADPGYQFRLDQGNQALERSQAARAGLLSGAALKASQTYGQGMGAQEYGAAYDRFNNNNNLLYNRFAGISGAGQQQTGVMATAGQNYAQGATQAYGDIGNAAAAKAASKGSWVSGLGSLAGNGAALYSAFSDINLKQDIKHIGEENGHKIYEFAYKAEPSRRFVGVMAQDVEKTNPEAVVIMHDGSLGVNYGMIGVNFREIA